VVFHDFWALNAKFNVERILDFIKTKYANNNLIYSITRNSQRLTLQAIHITSLINSPIPPVCTLQLSRSPFHPISDQVKWGSPNGTVCVPK